MLKKVIALALVFAFVNVHASMPVNNLKTLGSAFDQLNFALTVEWDQQDKDFYNTQMKDFQAVLADLQKKGMTNAEMITFAKSKIKNEKLAKDLDALFNVIEINKLSQAEARKFILDTIGKNYSQGANWNGRALGASAGLVLLLAIAIIIVIAADSGSHHGGGYYYDDCYDDYVCYDYYDSWGGYWYEDCYWETYCY